MSNTFESQASSTEWRSDYQIGPDEGRKELQTRITELEAQLADAQKDAARYQWIPVSGRLPKEGDLVNVVFDGCCMETDLFESGGFQCFGRRTTHWMPLPKMPVMQPKEQP